DRGESIDTSRRNQGCREERNRVRPRRVRVGCADERAGCRWARAIRYRFADDDRRGPRRRELTVVLRIGHEGQVARHCPLDAGDTDDFDAPALTFEAALQPFGEVLELHWNLWI